MDLYRYTFYTTIKSNNLQEEFIFIWGKWLNAIFSINKILKATHALDNSQKVKKLVQYLIESDKKNFYPFNMAISLFSEGT